MTIAIVAGGSAGIGQSAAVEIAKRGSGVILTYRTHPEGADETVAVEALAFDGEEKFAWSDRA